MLFMGKPFRAGPMPHHRLHGALTLGAPSLCHDHARARYTPMSQSPWKYSNQPNLDLLALFRLFLPVEITIKPPAHISLPPQPSDQPWCFPIWAPWCGGCPPPGSCNKLSSQWQPSPDLLLALPSLKFSNAMGMHHLSSLR